jgi:hypothetical protein
MHSSEARHAIVTVRKRGAACPTNSLPPMRRGTLRRPQLAVWGAPKYYNEATGTIGDYRLSDSGSAWGSADSIRLAVMRQSDPLLNHYVTEQMRADGTLLVIAWRVGTATHESSIQFQRAPTATSAPSPSECAKSLSWAEPSIGAAAP